MTTFDKIKEAFAEQLNIDANEIKLESDIFNDLRADSVDLYLLITNFMTEFDIVIPDEEVKQLRTIGSIVEYVDKKLADK